MGKPYKDKLLGVGGWLLVAGGLEVERGFLEGAAGFGFGFGRVAEGDEGLGLPIGR